RALTSFPTRRSSDLARPMATPRETGKPKIWMLMAFHPSSPGPPGVPGIAPNLMRIKVCAIIARGLAPARAAHRLRAMSRAPTPPSAPSLPLWQLLCACADAVAAVRKGQSLNDALAACKPAERPGAQALSFAVLRQMGTAQALRQRLVPKAPQPWVDALLLSALALALGTAYDAHTLVDQAVEAAKRRARPASGMVNAVLRRFLRERAEHLAAVEGDPLADFNHPAWWIAKLRRDWPE